MDITAGSLKRPSDALQEVVNPGEQTLDVPNNLDTRVKFIEQQRSKVIQMLCLQSARAKGIPDATKEPTKSLLPSLELFMRWLETNVEITPVLKERSKIDQAPQLIYANDKYHFEPGARTSVVSQLGGSELGPRRGVG